MKDWDAIGIIGLICLGTLTGFFAGFATSREALQKEITARGYGTYTTNGVFEWRAER